MTDIVQEYYSRIMKHMRSAVDNQLLHEQIGFPDVVEQVFHECGVGSVTELHDFYQNRVLRYHDNMLQQSQQLVSEYEKLKQSGGPKPAETFTLIRIRDEPSSDIQFPELEEKDDVVDTEHLLHLKDLTAYEITVEQEPVTGLTTDIDSKIASNIKSENDVRLPYLDVEDGTGNGGNLMTSAGGVPSSASGASGGSVGPGSGGPGGTVGGGGVGSSNTKDGCSQPQSGVTPTGGDCLSEANGSNLSMSDILPPLINARSNKTRKLSNYMDNEETVNLPRESKRQKLHDDSIADSSASTPPPPPLIPMRTPKSKKAKSKSGQSFSRQSAAAAKKSDK
ncbi:Hypothetical predicted protein [Octopus vulgaris]|uniref:Uncharacterized protein n=2 Tax=Octopus TaxID=6643 RepID=A0AA36FS71_OCTVU|nr:Hypothetical predicted protein [Octopus vulgaris]